MQRERAHLRRKFYNMKFKITKKLRTLFICFFKPEDISPFYWKQENNLHSHLFTHSHLHTFPSINHFIEPQKNEQAERRYQGWLNNVMMVNTWLWPTEALKIQTLYSTYNILTTGHYYYRVIIELRSQVREENVCLNSWW